MCSKYLTRNLISVYQIVDQNLQVTLNSKGCFIKDMNDNMKVIVIGTKVGRMFKLDVNMPKFEIAIYGETQSQTIDLNIWHKRIGHLNF